MEEDKITDFERAELYKEQLKSKHTFTILIGILMILLGYAVARAIYLVKIIQH